MKTTFYFADGTSWEWEDDPQDLESLEIKNKYFENVDLSRGLFVSPDIIKIVESLD